MNGWDIATTVNEMISRAFNDSSDCFIRSTGAFSSDPTSDVVNAFIDNVARGAADVEAGIKAPNTGGGTSTGSTAYEIPSNMDDLEDHFGGGGGGGGESGGGTEPPEWWDPWQH